MLDAEVDQSGRTDVLTVDTVLALANGVERAILIPKSAKQRCYAQLRNLGMRKALIAIRLFSAGLVLLLEDSADTLHTITIDIEYVGWEGEIKRHVLQRLYDRGRDLMPDQIVFRSIGKKSPAHELAWRTFNRYQPPDKRVTFSEIFEVC